MTRIRSGKLSSKYRWNSSCRRSVLSTFRRAEVHAFLECFKQFCKALLLFTFFGDIAGEGTRADNLIIVYDGIEHALEIEHSGAVLSSDLHDSRPPSSLQKSCQTILSIVQLWLEDKFVGLVAGNLGI